MAPDPDELFPIVDEDGNQISLAPRRICHDGKSKLLHPVVHLHLFDSNGNLFLQKRAATKDLLPGCWDTSVGGHVNPGEKVEDALKRETAEELGLKEFEYRFNKKYVWESKRERELVFSFTGTSEETPVPDPGEIDEGRFWSITEIEENLGSGIFTPNFEHEFKMFIR
jgi:isopentenyldiphosphate isomerase